MKCDFESCIAEATYIENKHTNLCFPHWLIIRNNQKGYHLLHPTEPRNVWEYDIKKDLKPDSHKPLIDVNNIQPKTLSSLEGVNH